MGTMQWDPELAHMATLHTKQCKYNHDVCRNTAKYIYSGQNIGIIDEWSGNEPEIKDVSLVLIDMWFDENEFGSKAAIEKYAVNKLHEIGHFVALMVDRNIRVGCAASEYEEKDEENKIDLKFLLTCNYAFLPVTNRPIYSCTSGKAGSKCETGTNPDFPFLCSVDESYDLKTL